MNRLNQSFERALIKERPAKCYKRDISAPQSSAINNPARNSIYPQARRFLPQMKRRRRVLPGHLKAFVLDLNNIKNDCKFCGKTFKNSQIESQKAVDKSLKNHEAGCRGISLKKCSTGECPICKKKLSQNYIPIHVKKIHGPDSIP